MLLKLCPINVQEILLYCNVNSQRKTSLWGKSKLIKIRIKNQFVITGDWFYPLIQDTQSIWNSQILLIINCKHFHRLLPVWSSYMCYALGGRSMTNCVMELYIEKSFRGCPANRETSLKPAVDCTVDDSFRIIFWWGSKIAERQSKVKHVSCIDKDQDLMKGKGKINMLRALKYFYHGINVIT